VQAPGQTTSAITDLAAIQQLAAKKKEFRTWPKTWPQGKFDTPGKNRYTGKTLEKNALRLRARKFTSRGAAAYLSALLIANTGFSPMPSISKLPAPLIVRALIAFGAGL
jgi:hypothetical protein